MADACNRWFSVWMRNALTWSKSARTALLGGFADPLFNLLALGYGLGFYVGRVDDMSYLQFLAAGILSTSAMNSATHEGLYMAYTRMAVLRTWDAMLAAPLSILDIMLGELLWLGTRSLISAGLILCVVTVSGMASGWMLLGILPLAVMTGFCFGAMALLVTSLAARYDFFSYYITLIVTPMVLLSGVFFPFAALPEQIRQLAALLPLYHIVTMVRGLVGGSFVPADLAHMLVPLIYMSLALVLVHRRLSNRLLG